MKIVKNIFKIGVLATVAWWAGACDKFDLDVNTDPNNPSTITKPNLLLTNIEYTLMDGLAGGLNDAQHGFMGMQTSFDDWNVPATSWNFTWNRMYATTLKDIEGLIEATVADEAAGRAENPHYLGIAQVLKAYAYTTMVDLFGDVPFSQANQGDADVSIRNPQFDDDADVYRDCKALLAEGIANLSKASGVKVDGDVIYAGDINKWKAFANSLKLKMAMTTRLVDPASAKTEIESIITAGGLIGTAAQDFQIQFGKTITPDYRHPWYTGIYTGGEFTYLSSQMMYEMLLEKDPRWPFYFRRQTNKTLDPNNPTEKGTIPCTTTPGCTYGYMVLNPTIVEALYGTDPTALELSFLAGLFGRDRSDPAGVPADGTLRTAPGVWPAGGYYDFSPTATTVTSLITVPNRAPGGGIFPALTHVNIEYYKIEAALAMGASVGGDPRTLFEGAIRKHITKVVNFGVATDVGNAVAPAAADIDAYVALWLARYDAAPTDNAKLNVVMKQLWISSQGAAYELWNAFRRTGLPSTIQEPINPARQEPKRMPYPQIELTLNPNAPQGVVYDRDPIFWDLN
jgi:hypothetical protein